MPSLGLQYGFLRPYWGRDFGEVAHNGLAGRCALE
jgi:hypothetical protein